MRKSYIAALSDLEAAKHTSEEHDKPEESGPIKILIVDDSELNRALLSDILGGDFEIIEACNGVEAMAILHEQGLNISLVLLDIVMPEMDGFEVLNQMNRTGWIKTIPVIMISAESGGAVIDRAYDLGAIDYINRPFDERTVKHRVACNVMTSLRQKEVQSMLSDQILEKEKDNNLMIEILSNIVEFRNGESGLHVLHVRTITERILKALTKRSGKYSFSSREIHMISMASSLHDIGKISIPTEILNKPGKLTPAEYEIMKHHTVDGANILAGIPFRNGEEMIRVSYQICRWHHERYDGSGYPDGLVGDDIPIAAQVVALADVYDALTSKRAYKDALTSSVAVSMIERGECGAFNPDLIACLKEVEHDLVRDLEEMSYGDIIENEISGSVQQLFDRDGTDVSRRMIKQIEHERMKFQHLADLTHEITFEYVVSPEMIKFSDWSAQSLGLPVNIINPLDNETWCNIFPQRSFGELLEAIRRTSPGNEVVMQQHLINTGNGERWNQVIAKAMWSTSEPPELEGAICKLIDINDTTETMHKLEKRAERDSSTGLFNQGAARRRITSVLSSKPDGHYALLFFDIDDFKRANDTRGHLFGDAVIREVAERMKANMRSSDITARVGGDEFVIFMEYGGDIHPLVERIYKALSGPFKDFNISLSMGIALTDGNPIEYDDLVNRADVAQYSVKKSTKGAYRFYDDSMAAQLGEKHEGGDK